MRYRSFYDLSNLGSFDERFDYLKLQGTVGAATFGFDRYINQQFYRSTQWRQVRDRVIARDEGCDLGLGGYEIYDRIYIHHMNPMTAQDIEDGSLDVLDPEFLITTTHRTHNAIHYGDESLLARPFVERTRGDTKLW